MSNLLGSLERAAAIALSAGPTSGRRPAADGGQAPRGRGQAPGRSSLAPGESSLAPGKSSLAPGGHGQASAGSGGLRRCFPDTAAPADGCLPGSPVPDDGCFPGGRDARRRGFAVKRERLR
jgi:hypothetical protein